MDQHNMQLWYIMERLLFKWKQNKFVTTLTERKLEIYKAAYYFYSFIRNSFIPPLA